MFQKLFLLLLAAVMAWFLGPTLSELIDGIPVSEKAADSAWKYLTSRSGSFYFQFFIWLIVFWFLIPRIIALFGFLTPQARRYATTKLLRRIHGVTVEFVAVAILFVVATILFDRLFIKADERAMIRQTEQTLYSPSKYFQFNPETMEQLRMNVDSITREPIRTNLVALTNFLKAWGESVPIKPEY